MGIPSRVRLPRRLAAVRAADRTPGGSVRLRPEPACSAHKFDPIPTADYHALYGVFANCEAPLDLPLIERPEDRAGGPAFESRLAAKRAELQEMPGRDCRLTDVYGRVIHEILS